MEVVCGSMFSGKTEELIRRLKRAQFAQQHVEKELPGVQAMFQIGCGGDANPYPRGKIEHARQHGKALGTEVCRVAGEKLRPVDGPLRTVLGTAAAPLQPVPAREELEKLAITLEEEMFVAAEELRFEYAAKLRDEIKELRRELAALAEPVS